MKNDAILPGTYTGIRDVSHPPFGVAVMLEEALKLVLLHARLRRPHHLEVGCTADLIHIAQHRDLMRRLDHSATHDDVILIVESIKKKVEAACNSETSMQETHKSKAICLVVAIPTTFCIQALSCIRILSFRSDIY